LASAGAEHVDDIEAFEVIELTDNPRQVADSIAIRVCETAWIDLVENSLLPPYGFFRNDRYG
jgi:hypothetical protein